jgi:hypothetical protein
MGQGAYRGKSGNSKFEPQVEWLGSSPALYRTLKFDRVLQVRQTLTELRTTLFKFVKMRESLRTRTFGRTPN